jgi:hypothetical protein
MYATTNVLSSSSSVFIPCGPKYLATFKEENHKPLCILYDIERKIHKNVYVAFDPVLSLGTQLYGTLIDHVFVAEKLMLYKNKSTHSYDQLEHILDHYIAESKAKDVYNFKLPFRTDSEPIFAASELNYNVYGILQFTPKAKLYKLSNSYGHFIIDKHPELSEVYRLYVKDDGKDYFVCNAYVNDIKTSYLLRKIFKNKINYKNIEYSDEETEVVEETRYVTCIWLPVHKKWKPYTFNARKHVDHLKKITSFDSSAIRDQTKSYRLK